ncbi:MAG: M56 family metallopeptidase [Oscillospiraceae bacterium]|jgi:beta-lactamase regulating signal transducer with metallopeptidase domain|nr:M56 family metallopeptidase [Oscillospiraceae bacterium]
MSKLFADILNLSLTASFAAIIVLLVRLPLKKAPKVFSYALWALVFFKLVCPFTLQLPASANAIGALALPSNIVPNAIQFPDTANNAVIPPVEKTENAPAAGATANTTPAGNSEGAVDRQTLWGIGAAIWALGTAVMLMLTAISYIRLKRQTDFAVLIKNNIYETDQIKTPFVFGIIRPKIYMPTGLAERETDHILRHERVHIKRLDHVIKPLAYLITVIHWFNPIAWLSYMLLSKDMELSADESVMRNAGADIRREYSASLYSLSVKNSGLLLSPLAFGETGIKSRVKNVIRYKKPSFWISAVSVFAILLTGCAAMATGMRKPSETDNPTPPAVTPDAATDVQPAGTTADFGLLSLVIPTGMIKSEAESTQYLGSAFSRTTNFNGWEGRMARIAYISGGIELLIHKYNITEDTAEKYIAPLVTEEYDTKLGRLGILEAQTGAFFDQVFREMYPFNAQDQNTGGGRVLTSDGQPAQGDTYRGGEIQENYYTLTDGRQLVSRFALWGTEAVMVTVITNSSAAYAQGQNILNTITPLSSDVTMSGVRTIGTMPSAIPPTAETAKAYGRDALMALFGITFGDTIPDFKTFDDTKLIVWCSLSDGAYSEGAYSELWRRLFDDPRTITAKLNACEYLSVDAKTAVARQVYFTALTDAPDGLAEVLRHTIDEVSPDLILLVNTIQSAQ